MLKNQPFRARKTKFRSSFIISLKTYIRNVFFLAFFDETSNDDEPGFMTGLFYSTKILLKQRKSLHKTSKIGLIFMNMSTSLQKQMSKGTLCDQMAKSVVTVQHISNETRLRGINKGSVNVENYADRVCNIYSSGQCGKTC